jgi:hypothetical protein
MANEDRVSGAWQWLLYSIFLPFPPRSPSPLNKIYYGQGKKWSSRNKVIITAGAEVKVKLNKGIVGFTLRNGTSTNYFQQSSGILIPPHRQLVLTLKL